MSKKAKNIVSVTFISEVENIADKSQIKVAYADLRNQIAIFAEASSADPNIIISHSSINDPAYVNNPVSIKLAELQGVEARIDQGKSPVVTPGYKSKYEPSEINSEVEDNDEVDEDEYEVPRVQAGPWPITTANTSTTSTPVVAAKTALDPAIKGRMEITIFSGLKKTEKSTAIVSYFLSNPDKELSVAEIANGVKLDNESVSIWLYTTAKKSIKAIKNVSRGVWLFDSTKVRI